MARLQVPSMEGDERPISLRRKRQCSVDDSPHSRSNSGTGASRAHGMSTPPATPKRVKKRVRFSDPGPSAHFESESSGLTPFVQRTSISTPRSKRRHSTPAAVRRSPHHVPPSGEIQFESLRTQILEDRAIRRLRRNGLSEELIKIEWDKKHAAKGRIREVERLRSELKEKDVALKMVKDKLSLASQTRSESGEFLATFSSLTSQIQEQERQIEELKAALQEKESEASRDPDWTLAARDPFDFDDEHDMMTTNYDQDFRESSMNDELLTTPTRLQTSFPSPPSTIPNTPSRVVSTSSAGTQASLPIPDPEKVALRSQLESLRSEISKLTSKIALHEDNQSRLTGKLSGFLSTDESHDHSSLDSALDTVLTQLALSQSRALEQSSAFSALGSEITKLGFAPGASLDDMVAAIASQFRQARLELEYITPGEVVEGFDNEKLLEMLVSRVRDLNQRVKEGDEKVDQYHEQEVSLRQQLNTRIDVMQDMQSDLSLAKNIIGELKQEISDKDVSNKRLQTALQTYRDEVRGLEKLIERMDKEKQQGEEKFTAMAKDVENKLQTELLRHDTTRADAEGKTMLIEELERRLNAALQAQEDAQKQIDALIAENDTAVQKLERSGKEREKVHGNALALRDARVSELRVEIGSLNDALKAAYSNILTLGTENRLLKRQVEEARAGQALLQDVCAQMDQMREPIARFLDTGAESTDRQASAPGIDPAEPQPILSSGKYFDGSLARRRSSRTKRRYDSGVGLLEEDEEGGSEDTNTENVEN
jgi:chromosome segregation ATPase